MYDITKENFCSHENNTIFFGHMQEYQELITVECDLNFWYMYKNDHGRYIYVTARQRQNATK